jgi:hypothetical protein
MQFLTEKRKPHFLLLAALAIAALACAGPASNPTAATEQEQAPAVPAGSLPTAEPGESASQPLTLGQDIPIAGALHIDESETPTDWNSDPPTSGQHYARWVPAGFYEEPIPDGFLVHNMEHGYVVVYYDCSSLGGADCTQLQSAIEAALAEAGMDPQTNTLKVVVVPRAGMGNPVTYASWGHLYKAEAFVPDELVAYLQTYRSNSDYAPEWNLP